MAWPTPPTLLTDVIQYLGLLDIQLQELDRVQAQSILWDVMNAEPENLVDTLTVFADGTNWNPGSGRGLYRYDESITSWVYLG